MATEVLGGLEGLFQGVANNGIACYVSDMLENAMRKNPFEYRLEVYQYSSRGIFTWLTGTYNAFEAEGREINPDTAIRRFFKTGSGIYSMALAGAAEVASASLEAGEMCRLMDVKGREWVDDLRSKLEEGISLAGDVALWLVHLSGGIITGPAVRSKARKYGITDIEMLPEDVKKIGENVLKLYDLAVGVR